MQASDGEQGLLTGLTGFVKTRRGKIMTGEIGLCLLTLIFKVASWGCYIGVPITEMVWVIFMMVLFSMELDKKYSGVHWLWTDFFRALTATPLFLITSIVCMVHNRGTFTAIMAEIFGIGAGLLLGYDAFLVLSILKAKETPLTAQTGQPDVIA